MESVAPRTTGPSGVVNNAVSQYRALFAFLQNDEKRARAEAAAARLYYEGRVWTERQRPLVTAELALANAFAGDAGAARSLILRRRDELRKLPDAFAEIEMRYLWATTMVVMGDRESALAELRIAVTQASPFEFVPSLARLDPIWSSLKDDPSFKEILKSAKPL